MSLIKPANDEANHLTRFAKIDKRVHALDANKQKRLHQAVAQLGLGRPVPRWQARVHVSGAMKLPIPNPHGTSEISVAKLREILNEIGVSREEWRQGG